MRELTALSNAIFSPDGFNFAGVIREIGRFGKYATITYTRNCQNLERLGGNILGLLCAPSAVQKWIKVATKLESGEPAKATRLVVKALSDTVSAVGAIIAYKVVNLPLKSVMVFFHTAAVLELGSAVVDLVRYQAQEKNPAANHMVRTAKRMDACVRIITKMMALALISTSLPLALAFELMGTISMIGIDYFKELRKEEALELAKAPRLI